MEDSVFTKIIRREIPAEILYETDTIIAILDQMPDAAGHTLVIPKKPVRNIFDVDSETFTQVMETARTLAPKIREAVHADGLRIIINNEPAGGQQVFHLHVHLIPFHNDNPPYFSPKEKAPSEALKVTADSIRALI